MMTSEEALKKAKKIPVPEPGSGELVDIPLEVLSAWMKLNGRKAAGWMGNILITAPDNKAEAEHERT